MKDIGKNLLIPYSDNIFKSIDRIMKVISLIKRVVVYVRELRVGEPHGLHHEWFFDSRESSHHANTEWVMVKMSSIEVGDSSLRGKVYPMVIS